MLNREGSPFFRIICLSNENYTFNIYIDEIQVINRYGAQLQMKSCQDKVVLRIIIAQRRSEASCRHWSTDQSSLPATLVHDDSRPPGYSNQADRSTDRFQEISFGLSTCRIALTHGAADKQRSFCFHVFIRRTPASWLGACCSSAYMMQPGAALEGQKPCDSHKNFIRYDLNPGQTMAFTSFCRKGQVVAMSGKPFVSQRKGSASYIFPRWNGNLFRIHTSNIQINICGRKGESCFTIFYS